MPRNENATEVLDKWNLAGAVSIENGQAYLTVKTITGEGESQTEGEAAIPFSQLVGITAYAVERFLDKNDEAGAKQRAYRRQSEKALIDGVLSATQFDAVYGKGSAKIVTDAAAARKEAEAKRAAEVAKAAEAADATTPEPPKS